MRQLDFLSPLFPLKRCTRCGHPKAASQFGNDITRRDGLFPWCLQCRREDMRGFRARDIGASRLGCRTHYRQNKAMYFAHVHLNRAVAAGKIVKPPCCPVCRISDRPVEAHHHLGYERTHWLDVLWRCRPCHMLAHRRVAKANQRRSA